MRTAISPRLATRTFEKAVTSLFSGSPPRSRFVRGVHGDVFGDSLCAPTASVGRRQLVAGEQSPERERQRFLLFGIGLRPGFEVHLPSLTAPREPAAANPRMSRILAFFAVFAVLAAPAAARGRGAAQPASWAQPEIRVVVAHGLMARSVQTFRPTDPITRGQLTALVAGLTEEPP